MPGALDGLKILDFTRLLPGPYATMCLADMGAEVLKVVSASRSEIGEMMPPFIPGTDVSAATAYLGRNKRCITLNLKDSRAIEIIHRLIIEQGFDIIIEQFRPGVMGKLMLDYEHLKAVKPDIIYCSLTGYGQDGPMLARAGHDINYIARSGIASYSGKKGQGPSMIGMQVADVAAGSNNSIIGILASVLFRKETGKGQFIDISMTDGMMAFNTFFAASYLVDGKVPEPETNFVNGGSLYDYYETQDGKYISFGGLEPQFFTAFCKTINRPDLIAGGITPPHTSLVKREIREIMLTKTRDEWVECFRLTDACVEPVMTIEEVLQDPLAKERQMVIDIALENGQTVKQLANPIKFSETKQVYKSIGVNSSSAGHTREILENLGYSQLQIETFAESGLFD